MPKMFDTIRSIYESESNVDDLELADAEEELAKEYGDVEDMEDDVEYTEEMVNVFERKSGDISTYYVESDMLFKYMTSAGITDVKEALDNVAESNSIDAASMCLIIESQDSLEAFIHEGCEDGDKDCCEKEKSKKAQAVKNFIKDAKEKGVKLVKRKDKKC